MVYIHWTKSVYFYSMVERILAREKLSRRTLSEPICSSLAPKNLCVSQGTLSRNLEPPKNHGVPPKNPQEHVLRVYTIFLGATLRWVPGCGWDMIWPQHLDYRCQATVGVIKKRMLIQNSWQLVRFIGNYKWS